MNLETTLNCEPTHWPSELPGFWGVKNVSEINLGVPGQVSLRAPIELLNKYSKNRMPTILLSAIVNHFKPSSVPAYCQADLREIYRAGAA